MIAWRRANLFFLAGRPERRNDKLPSASFASAFRARTLDGNQDGAAVVDMGAYEYEYVAPGPRGR